ncbi:serine/threonine-protein kinase [Photobacterium piscicola]|uniref:serine/threonine-protein kinase n=1 Tax=Photobacterium piscicola TaxID=1378299 RepID=UPI002E195DB5|nr:serine/threonine-protein kinase [Photobacterium piscicola]
MNNIHQPGNLIANRYLIEEYIDEGGMQQVYLATDKNINRKVALKTPKNSSASLRFQSSAIYSARVIHPNVAKTLDYFAYNGKEYLIEELILGQDLNTVFRNNFSFLDPCLVAFIGHHLAKAVAASHNVDVVHRDLKPSNIMVVGGDKFEDIKVTDFGIAKLIDTEINDVLIVPNNIESSIAGSKTLIGALPYMAPEIVLNQAKVDKYIDVWSIGAILYFLLTGKTPFSSQLAQIIINYHTKKTIEPIEYLDSSIHLRLLGENIFRIIVKCLDYDYTRRPTAADLVKEFSSLCYAVNKRKYGYIKLKKGNQGWGFIKNEGENDTFYHTEEVFGNQPSLGEKVCFAEYPGAPQSRAFPIIRCK